MGRVFSFCSEYVKSIKTAVGSQKEHRARSVCGSRECIDLDDLPTRANGEYQSIICSDGKDRFDSWCTLACMADFAATGELAATRVRHAGRACHGDRCDPAQNRLRDCTPVCRFVDSCFDPPRVSQVTSEFRKRTVRFTCKRLVSRVNGAGHKRRVCRDRDLCDLRLIRVRSRSLRCAG